MVNVQNRPFYLVSLGKLTLLFFVTQGAYAIVWFYLHWQAQNNTQAKKVFAAPRSILSMFFVSDLCRRLQLEQEKQGVAYSWSPQRLSMVFITAFALEFAIVFGVYEKYLDHAWQYVTLLLNLLEYYVLYQFQLVANRVMGDPFGNGNRAITPINALWIGFGVFLWGSLILAWLGFAPAAPPEAVPAP